MQTFEIIKQYSVVYRALGNERSQFFITLKFSEWLLGML